MKVGIGYDVHELVTLAEYQKRYPKRAQNQLIIGGVAIEHHKILAGHSDADVLVHAIMDALLGAAGFDDIGVQFPDSDSNYAGVSSIKLLEKIAGLLAEEKYQINNIDSVVIAQNPKIRPYIPMMKSSLAKALRIDEAQINIKATTTERLGFLGREEGIAAEAVVLINKV